MHCTLFRRNASVDVALRVAASTLRDAATLSQPLEAGLLFRRYQASQSNPNLGEMLDSIQVAQAGSDLNVSLELRNEQVIQLVQRNAFVLKM